MITVYATYHISGTRKLHWLNPRNSWCVQTFTCERHCLIELASMAAADAHPLDSWRSGFCSRLQMSWLWPMLTLGGKVCQGVNSDSGAFMRLGFSSCVCCSLWAFLEFAQPAQPSLPLRRSGVRHPLQAWKCVSGSSRFRSLAMQLPWIITPFAYISFG